MALPAEPMEKKEEVETEPVVKTKGVPKELIYEMRYGRSIYYRDYDQVLKGEKTCEEVMGSSFLQGVLVGLIYVWLFSKLDKTKFVISTNETGFKFAPRSWRNLDIAIFAREKVKDYKGYNQYIPVAPEVVIEIDTKADLRKYEEPIHYFIEKVQDLLDAGVKRVIWIFTSSRKMWVCEKGKGWILLDWNVEIEVMEGIKLNLEKMAKEYGII